MFWMILNKNTYQSIATLQIQSNLVVWILQIFVSDQILYQFKFIEITFYTLCDYSNWKYFNILFRSIVIYWEFKRLSKFHALNTVPLKTIIWIKWIIFYFGFLSLPYILQNQESLFIRFFPLHCSKYWGSSNKKDKDKPKSSRNEGEK